jgi:N-acetylglucosamine-6-phosphate deacetylase
MVFQEDQGFVSKTLFIENGRISDSCSDEEILDAQGSYVIPGLIDIHFHGCMGYDFCDGTAKALDAIAEYQFSQGITSICPASMTLPGTDLTNICNNAKEWANAEVDRTGKPHFVGINLEGPFVSHSKKGAQNPNFIVPPDFELLKKLDDASGGLVKLLAIAPETEGALELIHQARASKEFRDLEISLAHTACDYDLATSAFMAGANHVTHLFNAMLPFTHREPGLIGAAFDTPNCYAEIICDGVHIAPSAVRAAFAMFTDKRLILISDSMMATGLMDGMYQLGGQDVTVKGNHATLADGTLAGSVTNLMDCLRTAVSMGIPLKSAVTCATVNPAHSIGIAADYGSLEVGKVADIVILNKDLELVQVLKGQV